MPPGTLPLIAPYSSSQGPRVSLATLIQLQGNRPWQALSTVRDVFQRHAQSCRVCSVTQRPCGAGLYCVELAAQDNDDDTRTPTPRTSESGTAYVFSNSINISGGSSLSESSAPALPLAPGREPLLSRTAIEGFGDVPPLDPGGYNITLCHTCCRFVHDACWAAETNCCARCCNLGSGSDGGSSASEQEPGALRLFDLADPYYF